MKKSVASITATSQPILISIDETMWLLRLGKTKVYKLLNERLIIGQKHGSRTLVDYDSVVAYVKSRPLYTPCR